MSITPDTKNCIVLIDTEGQTSSFLTGLGISRQPPHQCVAHIPTKYFVYQLHNIFVTDEKLMDHILTKDGIIVLFSKVTPELLKRIDDLESIIGDIPIMYILDNPEEKYKSLELGKSRKFFRYDSTKSRPYAPYPVSDYGKTYSVDEPETWFVRKIREYSESKKIREKLEMVRSKALNPHESIKDVHFAKLFEDCKLPIKLWDHYGRLRIVHHSLSLYGFDRTIDQMGWLCVNWRVYKKSIGHEHLWNYTLTRFWIEIMEGLRHKYVDFKELWDKNPQIHNGNLHLEFYPKEVLFSAHSRGNWVVPEDLAKFGKIISL